MIGERKAQMDVAEARRIDADIAASDLDNPLWMTARPVLIKEYWSGEAAPAERHAEARLLWSDEALYVRFSCPQREPLIVSDEPQTVRKTIGLWDRDVCEIFIAPDDEDPDRYFEFEAAPTGEWLDLAIKWRSDERLTDWEFNSGMTVATRFGIDSITIAMRIPWKSMGRTPQAGTRWRANLFRCIGAGVSRGYLAWRPTRTEEPCFHLPEAFGEIAFMG